MCPHCGIKLLPFGDCAVCSHPRDPERRELCRKCHREVVYEEGLCYWPAYGRSEKGYCATNKQYRIGRLCLTATATDPKEVNSEFVREIRRTFRNPGIYNV